MSKSKSRIVEDLTTWKFPAYRWLCGKCPAVSDWSHSGNYISGALRRHNNEHNAANAQLIEDTQLKAIREGSTHG